MKVLMLVTLFTFSTTSFAGLLCDDFKCDISVDQYSSRASKTITETRKKTITTRIRKELDGDYSRSDVERYLVPSDQAAIAKMSDVKAAASLFDDPSYKLKSCEAKRVHSEFKFDKPTDNHNVKIYTATIELSVTCKIDVQEKKNESEMKEAQCQKVIACAAGIASTDSLASFMKLRDRVCGK